MSRMELNLMARPETLTNTRVFGREQFGNERKWTLDRPVAVCVTGKDEIMIADSKHRVHVFNQRGAWLRSFGTPGEFKGKMRNLVQICANKTGEFVVVAMLSAQLKFQQYDFEGNFSFEFGTKDTKSCHGIAIDKENRILSVDGGGKVVIFNRNGAKTLELRCKHVKSPAGIGVNDEELVFVGDRVNKCVQVYSYTGIFRYSIGGQTLTPDLISLKMRHQGDVHIMEIRQGKLCFSLFGQDGTLKSTSMTAERCFSKGEAFALLSNDSIVVTTKGNGAFIYQQTDKKTGPPVQQEHIVSDNIHVGPSQPQCPGPDCSQVTYQMQHPLHNFHASHQSDLQPYNFQAVHQPHPRADNFQAASPYQQQLLQQDIQATSQHQYHMSDHSLALSQLQHIQSDGLYGFYPSLHIPSSELAPNFQNIQPISSQEPSMTQRIQPQYLQTNMGQVVPQHVQAYHPNRSDSTFNDQLSHDLGLHTPLCFSNSNNNEPLVHQVPARSGASLQYPHLTPLVAVPLKRITIPCPSGGIDDKEQSSSSRWLGSGEHQVDRRAIYDLHQKQYRLKEQEKMLQMQILQHEREVAEISASLRASSFLDDEGFATPTPANDLQLLDVVTGPLASSLQSQASLDDSQNFCDHLLFSPSRLSSPATPFEAQTVHDPNCPLPLRYDPAYTAPNPAPSAIPKDVSTQQQRFVNQSRQHMSHSGYIKDFQKPCAVAVDSKDNVIVLDAGDNRVGVYNMDGKFLFSFGEAGSRSGQLVKPRKVAADPQTRSIVILEDTSITRIIIFCKDGKFLSSFLAKEVDKPRAMTVSTKSEIAIVQFSRRHVVMYELSGKLIRTIECSNFKSPTGIAAGDYEFFISDSSDNCVKVYNFDGQLLHTVGNEGLTPSPIGVAIASNGHVAVLDTKNDFRMTFFNPVGTYSAGYYSQKRHRNFMGFALTSTDDVVLICDDGKLWYYNTHRSPKVATFCSEKLFTNSPRKNW